MKLRSTFLVLLAVTTAGCNSSIKAPNRLDSTNSKHNDAETKESRGDDVAQVKFSSLLDFTGAGTWSNRIWINFDGATIKGAQSFEILSNVVFDRLGGLSFNTHSIFKSPSNIDHIC